MRDLVPDRKVKRHSVGACLATRYDFLESFRLVAHGLVTIKVAVQDFAFMSHKSQAACSALAAP
jgi:hypothetical protein